ncbi:hypothetical protein GHI93_00715 [Lactococcus hircilactis]|uniref:YcxB-like protein domain-containing protein n=1 Tax=Lactococcus hircilactis TaxID=1494462 RepID=A0A7X1Z6L4_9LACT|nr:hypothetical protein [Lactococcus hircilactis]MQW38472.1 hypothetical protein [Lactococcus hircilactis]
MFEFHGKASFNDYLTMVRRLSYRTTFVITLVGLIVGKVIFETFKWSETLLIILALVYLFLILFNFFIILPVRSKKKYLENKNLSEERNFTFSKNQNFEVPIYKISFFDDVIYISSINQQAMMIKKDWLVDTEKWESFVVFVNNELKPQIIPKINRR